MQKNNLVSALVVIAIVLGGVGLIIYSKRVSTPVTTQEIAKTDTNTVTEQPAKEETMQSTNTNMNEETVIKVFEVEGKPFSFSPSEIKVKKGDKVKIIFKNMEGFHDWVVDEFAAKTKQIQAGQTDSVDFIADKTGTFEYYCSVGTHRQQGMVGKLIVE